ncbi:ret finger protein-like 4A [Nycticebus coucang]|uniref:ret finger protein-like 4A n=1 Tax=Nycticebus coucang TaxID=9470 RepID=UPI00234D922B|nr:ret finger protein-like 4A [Nycticebus coucang]
MAEKFKDTSECSTCLTYLKKPMYLKCGFLCCLQCIDSLEKEPHGEGLLCPICPVVSQKGDIKPNLQLGELVSKVNELEPQLRAILQMNPRIRKFQVDMTFDVDTANDSLIISDDLRKVHCGCFNQNRSWQAERFSALCVLGSPRFTSGRHYWEVDVGRSQEWDVGICKESVTRQGEIPLSTEWGFWTVGVRKSLIFTACTLPLTTVLVNPWLHRVGIFLDMDVGTVSFYHVGDGSHIFTFSNIPAVEPLRPFFAPSNETDDDQSYLGVSPSVNPGIEPSLIMGRANETMNTKCL